MNTELKEVKKLAEKVEGWLSDKEGRLLYNFAKKCTGKGVIVEIGSWKGKSTIWLAMGSKRGNRVKLYAVDPHTGSKEHKEIYGEVQTFEEFKKNIRDAGVEDIVIPVKRTSMEAAGEFNEPVELIFIDGAHEYELVKLDFELWFPKVIEGGIMAFHDTTWGAGPGRVVKESVYNSRNFKNAGFIDSTTFARKVKENSLVDRLWNRSVLLLKGVYESTIPSQAKQ